MNELIKPLFLAVAVSLAACGGGDPAPSPTRAVEAFETPVETGTPYPAEVVHRTVLGVLVSTPSRRNQRSVDELHRMLFASEAPSLRSFYRLASGGRLNVTNRALLPPDAPVAGEVIEVTIPEPSGLDCSTDTWAAAAKAEAIKHGHDPSGYGTTFYITPRVTGCSNGVGTVGAIGKANHGMRVVYFDKSDTPDTSPLTLRTLVHEMGHNLGLGHARTVTCLDAADRRVSMSDRCTEDAQGDPTDAMGSTGRVSHPGPKPGNDYSPMDTNPRLFAASRAHDLGWLAPDEVLTVSGPGTFRLRPLYCAMANGAPRALRLASTTPGRDYWLETRVPCGGPYDNFRNGSTHHTVPETTVHGLLIRQATAGPGPSASTWLLDLHPGTTNASSGFVDAALSLGEVFDDPLPGGQRFEVTAVEPDGTIHVRLW